MQKLCETMISKIRNKGENFALILNFREFSIKIIENSFQLCYTA